MITDNQQPLEIAAKHLKPETLNLVRQAKSLHLRGWKILDRWAFNSPLKLKQLETMGEVLLLEKLQMQQDQEHRILIAHLEERQTGVSDTEILEREGVSLLLNVD